MLDVLIKNGEVYDGTGQKPIKGAHELWGKKTEACAPEQRLQASALFTPFTYLSLRPGALLSSRDLARRQACFENTSSSRRQSSQSVNVVVARVPLSTVLLKCLPAPINYNVIKNRL